MRYGNYIRTDTVIRNMHYILAEDFGEIMFLGLQKDEEVCLVHFVYIIYVNTN